MSKVFKSTRVSVDNDKIVKVDVAPVESAVAVQELEQEMDFFEEEEEEEGPTADEILESAKAQADEIIAGANQRADEITETSIKLAEVEAEKIKSEAKETGYQQGYAQGVSEAEQIKADAQLIVENAYVEKAEIISQAEPEIIDLISELVKKILTDEININRQVISAVVKQGLKQTNLIGNVNIHISKYDYETILENKDDILSSVETMAVVDFTKDIGLKQGDCIIETDFGNIDCGIGSQYKELKNSLYFLLKNR